MGGAWQKVYQFLHHHSSFQIPFQRNLYELEIQSDSVCSSCIFILLIQISRPTNIAHDYSSLQLMYTHSDIQEKHARNGGQDSRSVLSIARTRASLQGCKPIYMEKEKLQEQFKLYSIRSSKMLHGMPPFDFPSSKQKVKNPFRIPIHYLYTLRNGCIGVVTIYSTRKIM